MGLQVKELFDWARRRKILASAFLVITLGVGIMIGSIVSGRVSAMKALSFAGTNATPLAVPDPIPVLELIFYYCDARRACCREHCYHAGSRAQAFGAEATAAAGAGPGPGTRKRSGRPHAGFLRPIF